MPSPQTPPIAQAALDAKSAANAAQDQAERQAHAQSISSATATVAAWLDGHLDTDVLTAQYVQGGSVVFTDGTYSIAVDPQQQVWFVAPEGVEWVDAQRVETLADVADLLGIG